MCTWFPGTANLVFKNVNGFRIVHLGFIGVVYYICTESIYKERQALIAQGR